ncbi:hypothetical protein NE683_02115 [Bariatricus massiliensis]|uniref:PaaD zinc beta ribbon domain-containing protein n=2 Tax=Bariatricus massiliensis TaxID=1745713 RepID=A0ABS8DLG0_9FIRM|nr:zinc-ribbon domain-containing protein [Bariatricus massiliensis]MCB7303140.1 hypothetical protein [Bariatricus massiliensis]MCB7389249.1 hypothetical protein [Bariatricus massiliensis]MCB7413728.1 hypothetical protein [Bariatricus massiliensis]MCQ5252014.1 hypothetical protein [Bariatricus massiliensis]
MSLLKCPECGKEVSEYAEHCPNCGCPVSLAKKKEVVEGYCNINGVLCSKEEIQAMIKEDTIYKFLLHECKLSGGEACDFVDVIEFNHNEIPDNYCECHEHMLEALRAKKERESLRCKYCGSIKEAKKVHCPYCGSTYVEKRQFLPHPCATFQKYWYCKSCHSRFDVIE